MKKETILDTDRVSLFCYPDEKMVHHIVHKYVQGDDFRKLMTAGADAFLKHRCTKWLSDDRSSTALKKEDVEWGQQNWEGRILGHGWKYWAIVLPQNAIGKMTMNPIVERYASKGVEVKAFDNEDQAMKWLQQKP